MGTPPAPATARKLLRLAAAASASGGGSPSPVPARSSASDGRHATPLDHADVSGFAAILAYIALAASLAVFTLAIRRELGLPTRL